MNYLDLFSGIGAFALAVTRELKINEHFYSEIDEFCCELYKQNFPKAKPLGDISKIKYGRLPKIDVITGGFPCQDLSTANNKAAGLQGERSGLWFEMLRAIRVLRPKLILIENVSTLLVRGFNKVLTGLAEIGYDAEWDCIQASSIGLSHKRERLFVTAYPRGHRRPGFDFKRRDYAQVDASQDSIRPMAQCKANIHTTAFWENYRGNFTGLRKNNGPAYWMDKVKGIGNALVPIIAEEILRGYKKR